jgi:hypothetical protein
MVRTFLKMNHGRVVKEKKFSVNRREGEGED